MTPSQTMQARLAAVEAELAKGWTAVLHAAKIAYTDAIAILKGIEQGAGAVMADVGPVIAAIVTISADSATGNVAGALTAAASSTPALAKVVQDVIATGQDVATDVKAANTPKAS